MEVFQAAVGSQQAADLLRRLTSHTSPLEVVQKGHITQLLDAVKQVEAHNATLQMAVQSLRKQLDENRGPGDNLADRVVAFCEKSRKAGKSALTTAFEVTMEFGDIGEPGTVAPRTSGNSVELKLPHGPYISFDEAENVWTSRETSIFQR
jgi:hypothetical protein